MPSACQASALAKGESKYGLDLVGPAKPDLEWQAKAGEGYDLSLCWPKNHVRWKNSEPA